MSNKLIENLSDDSLKNLYAKFAGIGLDYERFMEGIKEEVDEAFNNANKEEQGVDRVGDWDEFSKYMRQYIEKNTVSKYGQANKIDLMSMTDAWICIWNIIRYSLRLWNGRGKRYDLEKIIHYAQMAITLSEGDLKKCGVRDDHNPNYKFWKDLD